MKTRHNPLVAGYTKNPVKGRAQFIRKLKARGLSKTQALEKTQHRFSASMKVLNSIW